MGRGCRFFVGTLSVVALVLSIDGVAAAFPGWEEPEENRPVQWSPASIDSPHKITYSVSSGYCVGKPRPSIRGTRVAWRARSAVITVFLHRPRVRFGRNEGCGDVGLGIEGKVRLAHSIANRALYDGSTSPPQRRARKQDDKGGHSQILQALVALFTAARAFLS
jgi:hypothetical protein